MGYFVTKIAVKKARKAAAEKKAGARRARPSPSAASTRKQLTTFTRQLSTLQDAGLPILRSLQDPRSSSASPARSRTRLIDVCDDIEGGSTLSEAMAKQPKAFDRLYVNMIKAGEAGGALEVILQRLAEFKERSQSLKRKVKGAMVYPIVGHHRSPSASWPSSCSRSCPKFEKIFKDFDIEAARHDACC